MNDERASDFTQRLEHIPPFTLRVVSYRFDGRFHCTVDNVDPGAVISRTSASTRDEAEFAALQKARMRCARHAHVKEDY